MAVGRPARNEDLTDYRKSIILLDMGVRDGYSRRKRETNERSIPNLQGYGRQNDRGQPVPPTSESTKETCHSAKRTHFIRAPLSMYRSYSQKFMRFAVGFANGFVSGKRTDLEGVVVLIHAVPTRRNDGNRAGCPTIQRRHAGATRG